MSKTEIEWATDVWNPTKGCDRVSPGCDHCYALTMAKRLKGMGQPAYQLDGDPQTSGPGFLAHEWPDALDWPLTVTKPMRVFVNSMSDLFHDNISDDYIAQVWAVMSLAPQHTFQVLTKRHGRMRALLGAEGFWYRVTYAAGMFFTLQRNRAGLLALRPGHDSSQILGNCWPLPNVWLGVSVETQQWADIRIPALIDTPAAVRFLSCEPLLGPVTFRWAKWHPYRRQESSWHLDGLRRLDWVIVGGESGPGARPMRAEWAREIRDQCRDAGVPFLFKQAGNVLAREWGASGKGTDPAEWPETFPREYPHG